MKPKECLPKRNNEKSRENIWKRQTHLVLSQSSSYFLLIDNWTFGHGFGSFLGNEKRTKILRFEFPCGSKQLLCHWRYNWSMSRVSRACYHTMANEWWSNANWRSFLRETAFFFASIGWICFVDIVVKWYESDFLFARMFPAVGTTCSIYLSCEA